MDLVPPYLAAYLFSIRKHSGEPGYLKRRLQPKDIDRAVYEKSMLSELYDLHLVALSKQKDELVYNPLREELPGGGMAMRGGTEHRTTIYREFRILARGHWLWTEYVFAGGRWLVTAFLGALIALLVAA